MNGFVKPCLPMPAERPPNGPGWIHEIKHDGFRLLCLRDEAGVRLFTRRGTDFTPRFPFIAAAVAALPVKSCLIDSEAIVCDKNGLGMLELIQQRQTQGMAVHCAFDLLKLDGTDLRRQPIEVRKRDLAELLSSTRSALFLNEHFAGDGNLIYKQACALGCEGIVSKRLGSLYRSGRSPHWLKVKSET